MQPQYRYTQFHLISAEELQEQRHLQPFKQRLKKLTQNAVTWIRAQLFQSSDIQVWHTSTANGTPVWNAQDPKTQRAIYGVSEADIRRWIEQSHRT
ncbi:MAG: hypothetical protein AAF152_18960 [Cyanobacteria bacterium P01_A01_bin.114]